MSRNISSHSIEDILNLPVEDPTGFQSPEEQGKDMSNHSTKHFSNFLS